MKVDNYFNLIDEPWIPVADAGQVSLQQIFTNPELRALGGNPIQKIAVLKLLLAIAQSACKIKDDTAWSELGVDGMSKQCLDYLNKWHEKFWLYADAPFLQLPEISTAKVQSVGAVIAEVATGNTTVLTEFQQEKQLLPSELALLLVTLMGFALGGKKTDNSVVLSSGYSEKTNEKGKPSTGKPGPSVGFMGFLHSFVTGSNIQESLWLNLLTEQQVESMNIYPEGIGVPPWEHMPQGESCEGARRLQKSLMGRLVPMSRFCLLTDRGFHYSEGILHSGFKEGVFDPSMAVNNSGKDPKAIWVDSEKRPWRHLTALLYFLSSGTQSSFECKQLVFCIPRARRYVKCIGVWSGGLRVSSNAGEQYVSGSDDFVDSQVYLDSENIGEVWYDRLTQEMAELDSLSKIVYSSTKEYFKSQNMDGADRGAFASNLFWQLSEKHFQGLLNASVDLSFLSPYRTKFATCANTAYDAYCPKDTARQLDAWARCKPKLWKYQHSISVEATR